MNLYTHGRLDGPWKRNRLCATTSRRSAFHKNDSHTEKKEKKKKQKNRHRRDLACLQGMVCICQSTGARLYACWSDSNLLLRHRMLRMMHFKYDIYLKQNVSTRPDYVNTLTLTNTHTKPNKPKNSIEISYNDDKSKTFYYFNSIFFFLLSVI